MAKISKLPDTFRCQILENNQKLLKINDLELKPIIAYRQEGEEVEVLLDANKIRAQLLM